MAGTIRIDSRSGSATNLTSSGLEDCADLRANTAPSEKDPSQLRATTAVPAGNASPPETEAHWKRALEASAAGTWAWDARTNQVYWDDRFREMCGLAGEAPTSLETWLACLHPEDRPAVLARIDELRRNPGDDHWDVEVRAMLPGEQVCWIHTLGRGERSAQGELLRLAGISVNITERKHREAAGREGEEVLRTFVARLPLAVAMFDRDMRYLSVNRQWLTDYGLTADIVGRSHYEVFPEIPERWKEVHRRALAGESDQSEEDRSIRADGTKQWLKWSVLPWRTTTGAVGGLFVLSENITRRKEAEEAFRLSEERTRLAAEATGFGTFDYDPAQRRSVCSPELYKILGVAETAFIDDDTLIGLIHPDDRDRYAQIVASALDSATDASHACEYRIARPDGAVRWIRDVGRTYSEGEPRRVTRIVGSAVDITERVLLRQQLEESLRRTDDQLHAIVEAAPLGIAVIDLEGRVMTWNRAAERIYGYKASEVIGRVNPAIPESALAEFRATLAQAIRGETVQTELAHTRKDGLGVRVSLSLAPLHDKHGEVSGVIVLAEDVTSEAKTKEELGLVRAAIAHARDDEARRIARYLHDDITQRLALLSSDIGTAAAAEESAYAERLLSYQERIFQISEGVREISHQMHPSILDDLGLLDALDDLCRDFSRLHNLPISFQADAMPDRIPAPVASCLYMFAQEALRNAAKYAKASQVSVLVGVTGGSEIRLTVADSGVGFDPDSVRSGLGLHSIRERTGLVNGTVCIKSGPDMGTRITVRVPLPKVADE